MYKLEPVIKGCDEVTIDSTVRPATSRVQAPVGVPISRAAGTPSISCSNQTKIFNF